MRKWLKRLVCKHRQAINETTSRIQDGSGTAKFTCTDCHYSWSEFVYNARK